MALFFFPKWTEKTIPPPGRILNPLGTSGLSQAITEALLPGMITQTYRAKYYSFYPWILYSRFHLPKDLKKQIPFMKYYLRNEAAFILANALHEKESQAYHGNIYGIEAGRDMVNSENYDLDFEFLKAGYGYHRQSLTRLEILPPDKRFPYPLPPGEKLAKIIDDSLPNKWKIKIVHNDINKKDLANFALRHCSCQLAQYGGPKILKESVEAEVKLLNQLFFSGKSQGGKRRKITLEVIRFLKRILGDLNDINFRTTVYFGYHNGKKITFEEDWIHVINVWKIYQLQEYFSYALQGILQSFLVVARKHPIQRITVDHFVESIFDKFYISEHLRSKYDHGEDVLANTAKDLIQYFEQSLRSVDESDEMQIILQDYQLPINEYTIQQNIKVSKQDVSPIDSLLLLLYLYTRMIHTQIMKTEYWVDYEKMLKRSNSLGLNHFATQYEAQFNKSNPSLEEVFWWVLVHFVINRHNQEAARKLLTQGRFSYYFIQEDDAFIKLRDFRFDFASSKLYNAMRILKDIRCLN